jgi:hypothetical protein
MKKKSISPQKMFRTDYIVPDQTIDIALTEKILNRPIVERNVGFTRGTSKIHTNTPPVDLQPLRNSQGMIISDVEVDNPDLDISLITYRVSYPLFVNAININFDEYIPTISEIKPIIESNLEKTATL